VNSDVGAFRCAYSQQTAYPWGRDLVQRAIPVPLVKTTGAGISFFLWNVGWKVEVEMVNTFHFESWREIEMVLRHFTTP
jgi:hypothetical protein